MSADTIPHTARLPHGYRVQFTWSPGSGLKVEWDPDAPRVHSARHRRKFFEAYAAARRDFLRDVATSIGGSVGVVDVPGEVTDDSFGFECVPPATKH
jgi:hypothetical protein